MRIFFKVFPDISHISQNGLKKLFYNNKIPTYAELMEIKRGLIPQKYDTNKEVKARKDRDPKFKFLRQIHSNPKKVEIHHPETDKVVLYSSIYKAALALDQNTGVISMYN